MASGNLCDPLTDGMAKDGEFLLDQKVCQILKLVPVESETNYSWATHFLSKADLISTVCNSGLPNEFRQKRECTVNAMSNERAKTLA